MGKGAGRRSHSLSFFPARYMLSVSSSPCQSSETEVRLKDVVDDEAAAGDGP